MRESGILMHITSLPGAYGVGTLGANARAFVDFLKEAGQTCWQMLPLSPTGYGNSPYQSCSTFAGNHYLIDPDLLVEQGLLAPGEAEAFDWGADESRVDFGKLYENRLRLLRLAYARFPSGSDFEDFCRENSDWLPDYALFMALKAAHGGLAWYEWERPLKFREPEALWQARQQLRDEVRFHRFLQYEFHLQWTALREYAHDAGVRMIGDVPIYVPLDSADVWANPELFQLTQDLEPVAVAGCPPDAFTADGQLWGNPLYRWDVLARDGYGWWLRRLQSAAALFDVIRFDHFRGLESYWAVPYGDKTARGGAWKKGPGIDFIRVVKRHLPNTRLIAEDLGFLTPEVFALRDESGFPGMKVLGFAFDSREPSDYLPHTYHENAVCYTGTHDNMTAAQWFATADPEAVEYAAQYMALTQREGYVWGMIRTAMASVCGLCIIPMQDYLELGGQARMNLPGSLRNDNWTWRMLPAAITPALTRRIEQMTRLYGRSHKQLETGEEL